MYLCIYVPNVIFIELLTVTVYAIPLIFDPPLPLTDWYTKVNQLIISRLKSISGPAQSLNHAVTINSISPFPILVLRIYNFGLEDLKGDSLTYKV